MMRLRRELGVAGAVMMGLGAMVGTGVFVSIGIAAGVAGPAVILAVAIAAAVAVCNALSSAQLAASHAVSGGTYEYGYRYLNPWLGFTAGWMFMVAKSASAATAALGFAGYLLNAFGFSHDLRVPIGVAGVAVITLVVAGGMRRSSAINIVIVSITLLALAFFVVAGTFVIDAGNFTPFIDSDNATWRTSLFQASALMFVAYTGYGRIATLGEEVRDPRRVIPLAIIITMVISMLLYMAVAVVGIGTIGAEGLWDATSSQAAPLATAARTFSLPWAGEILAAGAITAMLGVLLNLVLGLSRVLFAMARRGDMPDRFSRVDDSATPLSAVVVTGLFIGLLVLIGDVKTTWSFSAFTVLVYYALTNLAALRLKDEDRLYPRWVAVLGLVACLFLAFQVETSTWLAGLALIALGLVWHGIARRGFKAGK